MTIANDLQNLLYERVIKSAAVNDRTVDPDDVLRVVFEFLLDGDTVGFVAARGVMGNYVDAINEIRLKILPKPD